MLISFVLQAEDSGGGPAILRLRTTGLMTLPSMLKSPGKESVEANAGGVKHSGGFKNNFSHFLSHF